MTHLAHAAAKLIREQSPIPGPPIGLILGSGLGGLANALIDVRRFPFDELPGFPRPTVEGHAGNLIVGRLGSVGVVCLQGRAHLYEGHDASVVKTLVRTLRLLGCEILVVTNAAGSLREETKPGSLMVLRDHINMLGRNPLVGPNDDDFGPRFPSMIDAYDPELRERLKALAQTQGLTLHEGVYLATLGPTFETPAEIRGFRSLGADAVGMSTVPEVIVARHCGMRVAAISVLTNMAAGMDDEPLTHEQTLACAGRAAADLERLITTFVTTTNVTSIEHFTA